jgi:uncharacterized iron-regulated protein
MDGDRAALTESARKARFALVGEKHDNPDHHQLQAEVIAMIAGAGRKPVVALRDDRSRRRQLGLAPPATVTCPGI